MSTVPEHSRQDFDADKTLQIDNVLAPHVHWSEIEETKHFVQFYETDDFLIDSLSGYISTGLSRGDACIVLATDSHRQGLEERLGARGFDLASLDGQYIFLDAAETLSHLMVDGSPDASYFTGVVGNTIERVAHGKRPIRIFGELVSLLCVDGNRTAAIRLEELWNELRHKQPFSLFCAYWMPSFNGQAYREQFREICKQHAHVIPSESYTALHDVDERLRAISLLQQQAISLRELEKREDAFISMASHELRTPVTSLKGFTQILQRRLKHQADPQSLFFLERMNAQLNRLTNLISDLLDVSKIEAGILELHRANVDCDELVRETVEAVQANCATHRLDIEGKTEAQVYADRDRLEQVLMNLLTNAIKYSPEADSILIRLRKVQGQVEVAIQDFGIGIPEEHQERVFERFYQVSGPEQNTYPGLGIGLYIARTLIERHGGRLWLKSRQGAGSTFYFTLPIHM
jgi:signal transduction histidine kinase